MIIPAGSAGDWFTITFATPFEYNGVENLVVDIERSAYCSSTLQVRVAPSQPSGTSVLTSYGLPSGFLQTWLPITKFHFSGGDNKIDFVPVGSANTAPLNSSAALRKVQMLYSATSISGSGPITGIGLQVSGVTTAQTYTYTMKLGHTVKTNLTATWNDNYDAGGPVTVASSVPYSIPAGVPDGTFIWFPMPGNVFTYDGIHNLVIELSVEGASGTTQLATHPTANVNRMWGDPASATATLLNYL